MAEATQEKTTRQQVEELFDGGMTEAGDIAEKLGKEKPTIYVHLRNIRNDRGIKSRGRGRPPKAQTDGEAPKATRPAPKAKSNGKSEGKAESKATRPAPGKAQAENKTNGNHITGAERFPVVKEAIEQQLREKRREVEALEKMLAGLTQ
jgi:DNA-binding transcriptional ArsR family regulator